MSIFSKLKSPFKTSEQKLARPPKQAEAARKERLSAPEKVVAAPSGASVLGSLVLKQPHISERATNLAHEGKYVFRVSSEANKIDVKRAVEELYRVKVTGVNVVKQHGKVRRRGRITGRTPDYKKAIVTIAKGQKIDIVTQ